MKFQPGQRVICIEAPCDSGLKIGNIYTVTKVKDANIICIDGKNGPNDGWYESRFASAFICEAGGICHRHETCKHIYEHQHGKYCDIGSCSIYNRHECIKSFAKEADMPEKNNNDISSMMENVKRMEKELAELKNRLKEKTAHNVDRLSTRIDSSPGRVIELAYGTYYKNWCFSIENTNTGQSIVSNISGGMLDELFKFYQDNI